MPTHRLVPLVAALAAVALALPPGVARLDRSIDSSGGSAGVRVTFTQTATGHVSTARIERSKTDIRL